MGTPEVLNFRGINFFAAPPSTDESFFSHPILPTSQLIFCVVQPERTSPPLGELKEMIGCLTANAASLTSCTAEVLKNDKISAIRITNPAGN